MPTISIPFAEGYDEGTDTYRTPKFLSLINYQWNQRGQIQKRYGYSPVTIITTGDAYEYVESLTITAGGSGYTTGEYLLFGTGGGSGAGFSGVCAVSGGTVTAASISQGGYGYTSAPTVNIFGGSGSGAVITANMSSLGGSGVRITNLQNLSANPQGQLSLTDGNSVYRQASQGWETIGALSSTTISTSPLPIVGVSSYSAGAVVQACNWDVTQAGNYQVYGFGGVMLAVDATTETIVAGPQYPTAISTPGTNNLVVSDGVRYAWSLSGGSGAIAVVAMDVSVTPPVIGTESTPLSIISGGVVTALSTGSFDAQWNASADNLAMIYQVTGASEVAVSPFTYTSALGTGGLYGVWSQGVILTAAMTGTGCITSISVGSSGNVYFAYAYTPSAGGVVVFATRELTGTIPTIFATSAGAVTSVSNLTIAETNPAGTEFHVAFTCVDANGIDQVRSYRVGISGPTTQTVESGTLTCGLTLWSRAYCPDTGSAHAMCYSLAGQGFLLMDLSGTDPGLVGNQAVPIASVNPRVAFGEAATLHADIRSPGSLMTPYYNATTGNWQCPVTISSDPGETALLNLQQASINYSTTTTAPATEWTSLLYPTGVPTVVGTEQAFEACFLAPPVIVSTSVSVSSGNVPPGVYAYQACYERVADDGSIIRSPPSIAVNVTQTGGFGGSASGVVTINVSSYCIGKENGVSSPQDASVYVVLYRTEAGGTQFLRVANDPFNPGSPDPGGSAHNVSTAGITSISDPFANTAIASNPEIYTAGGVFDNVCPPSCTIAARVRDRAYLAGTPDGFSVYYSDSIQNTGSTMFHDEQTIQLDDDGPVTGIAELDASVIIFKANSIYIVFGVEGGNTGAGNTLSTPQLIPTAGIGCTIPTSLVTTAEGVWFQSARGIELLDRSQTVQFIGEPVKNSVGVGFTGNVAAALSVPTQYQMRFYLTGGSVLVYSTIAHEWSIFAYSGISGHTNSAISLGGVPYWCTNNTLVQEQSGSYSDNGSVITSSFQSGFITFAQQLENYGRFRALQIIGQQIGDAGMTLTFSGDYSTSAFQVATFTAANIDAIPGFTSGGRVQLEVRPSIEKLESISISGSDIPTSTASGGIAWSDFELEVTQKPGRYRNLAAGAKQ